MNTVRNARGRVGQVSEAAERLGVHPSRVRLLAREGRLARGA
jgi:DNA-binding transcriptional regulator YdaS (Cro superfamily)